MAEGHEIVVMDNFFTGRKANVEHWLHHPNFSLVRHDVIQPILLEVDRGEVHRSTLFEVVRCRLLLLNMFLLNPKDSGFEIRK